MFNRHTAAIVLTAVCCTAGSQALGSSGRPRAAAASSLSRTVASLSTRVKTLERRVNALAALSTRRITVTTNDLPLITQAGTSFQGGSVDCSVPNEVAVGGGIGYPAGGEFSTSVVIASAPNATNGWSGIVYSPKGDNAHIYVLCATLGFG